MTYSKKERNSVSMLQTRGHIDMSARVPIRVVKLAVSMLFFCASSLRDVFMTLIGRRPGSGVVIYYHAVPREYRSQFAHQIDILLRWAKPVTAAQREPCRPGERCVAITFDDGLKSVVANALPELQRRQIPATLFIVVQSLDKTPIWMSSENQSADSDRVMSLEELRDLPSDLFIIGSHTLTHPRLSELSETDARREISDSRTQLQNILKRKVNLFSFPYGIFTDTLVQYCRDAGYERVFTTQPRSALTGPEEFVSGRIAVEPTDWPLEFRLKILGAYRWLPAAIALKRGLKSALRRPQDSQRRARSQYDRESCSPEQRSIETNLAHGRDPRAED